MKKKVEIFTCLTKNFTAVVEEVKSGYAAYIQYIDDLHNSFLILNQQLNSTLNDLQQANLPKSYMNTEEMLTDISANTTQQLFCASYHIGLDKLIEAQDLYIKKSEENIRIAHQYKKILNELVTKFQKDVVSRNKSSLAESQTFQQSLIAFINNISQTISNAKAFMNSCINNAEENIADINTHVLAALFLLMNRLQFSMDDYHPESFKSETISELKKNMSIQLNLDYVIKNYIANPLQLSSGNLSYVDYFELDNQFMKKEGKKLIAKLKEDADVVDQQNRPFRLKKDENVEIIQAGYSNCWMIQHKSTKYFISSTILEFR